MALDPSIVQLYAGLMPANVRELALTLLPTANSMIAGFLGWNPSLIQTVEVLPGERSLARGNRFGIDFGPGQLASGRTTRLGHFQGSSGNQLPYLALRHRPVKEIVSVHVNPNSPTSGVPGGEWPAETLIDPKQYYIDYGSANNDGSATDSMHSQSGKLMRRFGFWDQLPRSIRVIYKCGLTVDELQGSYADIATAFRFTLAALTAKQMGAMSIGSAKNSGVIAGQKVASVSVRDFAVSFNQSSGAGQFGGGTGGNSGGAGSGLPDEATSILVHYVSMRKYLG